MSRVFESKGLICLVGHCMHVIEVLWFHGTGFALITSRSIDSCRILIKRRGIARLIKMFFTVQYFLQLLVFFISALIVVTLIYSFRAMPSLRYWCTRPVFLSNILSLAELTVVNHVPLVNYNIVATFLELFSSFDILVWLVRTIATFWWACIPAV